MKKKVMIVGAGENQVPIISLAQRKGYAAIVVSVAGDYPGFNICDKSYTFDVRDKENILATAKNENICGILTDQTDMAVPTVAYVSDKLGLPGIGYECALRFTDKYLMRTLSDSIGLTTPKFHQVSSFNDALLKFKELDLPVVVKPVDNQGSRGISKLFDVSELEKNFLIAQRYSSAGKVIIEEFFNGREIVVEGFSSNYHFENLIIGDSENFDMRGRFIPKQRIFPSTLNKKLTDKVLSINKKLVEKLGLPFGITHSEYLVNENTSEVCLIETAARGGGVFISSNLIPLSCGLDVNDLLLDWSVGIKREVDLNVLADNASGYLCFFLPEGVITEVKGISKINSLPGVYKSCLDGIKVGKEISGPTDKTSRFGPILLHGKDRDAIQNTIEAVKNILSVKVETENGSGDIIW